VRKSGISVVGFIKRVILVCNVQYVLVTELLDKAQRLVERVERLVLPVEAVQQLRFRNHERRGHVRVRRTQEAE